MATDNTASFESLNKVLESFEGVISENGHYRAMCPVHRGERPAIKIDVGGKPPNRTILVHCHAECGKQEVLEAASLTKSDLFERPRGASNNKELGPIVATYDYVDLAGDLIFQVTRHKDPKDFRQRRPDGKGGWIWGIKGLERILYNLPAVTRAVMDGETIFVCEGEKDCDNARVQLGIVATTCPEGAKKWRSSYNQTLRGAHVVLIPDNDAPGKKHMDEVALELVDVAKSVRVLTLPGVPEEGGDLSDWLGAGGSLEDLEALVETTDFFLHHKGTEYDEERKSFSISAAEFVEVAGESADWVVEGILAKGSITSIAGLAKYSGKTTYMTHMTECILEEKPFLGRTTKRTNVVYATEQGNNFVDAMRKASLLGYDESRFRLIPYRLTVEMEWSEVIEGAIEECKRYGAECLIVDTFAEFARIRNTEENNSGDISEKMGPLKKAARVEGLAVGFTRHSGKDGRARGSSQFEAEVDIMLDLRRGEGDSKETERKVDSIGRYDASVYKETIELTDGGYISHGYVGVSATSHEAKSLARKYLPTSKENALSKKELWDTLGEVEFSESTLDRVLDELVEAGELSRRKGGGKGNPWLYWKVDFFPHHTASPNDEERKAQNSKASKTTSTSTPPKEHGCGSGLIVDDSAALSEMVSQVQQSPGPIGFDVETYPQDDTARSLDPRRGKVAVLSVSDGSNTYVVDAKKLPPDTIRTALQECLSNKPLIAHNAPFDLAFVRRAFGYEHDGPVYDTLVLDAMLFYATGPLTEKKGWKGFTTRDKDAGYKRSLKDAVQHRLGLELDKTEQTSDWSGEITPEMVSYAAADAEILIHLKDVLVAELETLGMSKVVELEARFTPTMSYASDNGFALDVEGWKQHAADAQAAIEQALEDCNKLAPEVPEGVDEWKWNASNHRKVGLALETLGATVRKSPKGNYKTDEEALKGIKKPAKAKRLAEAILRYRTNEKYVTTWGENWFQEPFLNTKGRVHQNSPDHLMVVDGRVHAKFNQLVASGRGSSKQPNMQNLPPEIRHYFVAPPGRKLLIADYSQLEYVAAAHVAGDEALLQPLREGRDFHQVTAEMIVTDRSRAKMVNFGVLYGMGTKALSKKLGTTERVARGYIDSLLGRAPKLAAWCIKQSDKSYDGVPYATTLMGRRRLVDQTSRDGRWHSNRSQLLNHPIQGACAEGYKIAGALLWERRHEFKGNPLLVNMIHDEFVIEVDEGGAESDAVLLETLMLEGMREVLGDAPVSVDVTVADHWGEEV